MPNSDRSKARRAPAALTERTNGKGHISIESEQQATLVSIDTLRPHPRNYRTHPEDEIVHLMESIRANGFYRNIVISSDGTILAGHGAVEAARKLGMHNVPAYRMDYGPDDPRALKLLVSDNEISHLAMPDDRALTELLREINESDLSLLGTGYDEMMLANLLFVTRPKNEIADLDAAAQWVGMPEYTDSVAGGQPRLEIIVHFNTEENRQEFCRRLGLNASTIPALGAGRNIWWPKQVNDDVKSVRFTTLSEPKPEQEGTYD